MNISEIYLFRGPDSQWLKALPAPFCDYQPATTLGELERLAPNMWRIWARRCLRDVVVYGNGCNSLAIRHEDGKWRLHGYEGVDGKDLLPRGVVEAALQSLK